MVGRAEASSDDTPPSKRRCKAWRREAIQALRGAKDYGHRLTDAEYQTLLQLRRCIGGSVEYMLGASDVNKMGPSSFEELSAWPDTMLMDWLAQPGGKARMGRLVGVLQEGLIMHSDCSGKLSPEATLMLLSIALSNQGVTLKPDWLALWRTSDIAKECQEFIRNSNLKPIHCFVDFMGDCRSSARRT